MAKREKRGWIWTPEEKEWAKTWQQSVAGRLRRLGEQASRFGASIPEFAGEASSRGIVQPAILRKTR